MGGGTKTPAEKPIKLFKEVVDKETFHAALKCIHLPTLSPIHLPTLNLRACKLKYDIWEDLSSREIQVDELKLDYTNLRKKIDGLPKCLGISQVKKLSLIDTRLNTESFKTLLKELEKGEKIELNNVNLMHVQIDTEGFEIFAKILNLLPPALELNVTNCGLTDEAIEIFYQTLSKDKVIHNLALGQSERITPDGMKIIGKLAAKCQATKLDLSVCYLTDEHLKKAGDSLPDCIESIDLRENTSLSAEAIMDFANKRKSLKEIDVRNSWFDPLEFQECSHCKIISEDLSDEESDQPQSMPMEVNSDAPDPAHQPEETTAEKGVGTPPWGVGTPSCGDIIQEQLQLH